MIVAGSDTAAAAITHVFYHLAKDPKLVTELREELKTSLPNDSKFLGAIIYETLRLHPSVPSGVLRQTPAAGLMIKNAFIPGGVTISTPTWSLSRCMSGCAKLEAFRELTDSSNSRICLLKTKRVPS
jgi:cytochrome P450